MIRYLKSDIFKKYVPDWTLGVGLIIYFFAIAEHARPFARQFSLSDLTIQHPFAVQERVTGIDCIIISSIGPVIVMLLVVAFSSRGQKLSHDQIHLLQISVLGLFLSLSINGVFTDILKNWIARPRPDFLARCGPKKGTSLVELVGIDVCTAPLGQTALVDGMRSTPSGHSSISFSGLLYLTLWLVGQFQLFNKSHPLYKLLLCLTPLLVACYIALSRTQDYRHHFTDIIMGGTIGIGFALSVYHRYFPYVWSKNSNHPITDEDDTMILPTYNTN